MRRRYYRKKSDHLIVAGIMLAIFGVGIVLALLPLMVAGGIGFLVYRWLVSRPKQLNTPAHNPRLQDLNDQIGRADRQIHLLEDYLNQKEYTQYGVLSRQLLPQLETIQQKAEQLKSEMGLAVYQRISTKVKQTTGDIKTQLDKLGFPVDYQPLNSEEERVQHLAPELLTSYRNIRLDDRIIRDKIKTSPNRSELTALHDANMKRFEDILAGYLAIKQSPKDFHQAQERLERAKATLEQFDLDLDETLKELNEKDLSDFEVSLRLMSKQEVEHEN